MTRLNRTQGADHVARRFSLVPFLHLSLRPATSETGTRVRLFQEWIRVCRRLARFRCAWERGPSICRIGAVRAAETILYSPSSADKSCVLRGQATVRGPRLSNWYLR